MFLGFLRELSAEATIRRNLMLITRYFAAEQQAIDELAAAMESVSQELTEFIEEHSGEDVMPQWQFYRDTLNSTALAFENWKY